MKPVSFRIPGCSILFGLLMLAGCATEPVAPLPASVPAAAPSTSAAISSDPALVCPPPAAAPQCPDPRPVPPPEDSRGKLRRADWTALPGLEADDPSLALQAFTRGCEALVNQAPWKAVCADAMVTPQTPAAATQFFRNQFDLFQVLTVDDNASGLITGYYEPLLTGSRTQSKRFRYPVYRQPQDLLTIDLSAVYPDLKHRRLRGRLEGNKVVPYFSRSEIDVNTTPLKGLELAWVDDAVDLFFLQIQGSGQVQLEDGTRMRIGYADQNGHPFRSLGGALVRRGEMKLEKASMQGIKEWARNNPRRVQEFMNINPSYVFFRELPSDLPGPLGSLGVPLTPERSLAIDVRVIPLGAPVFLATTLPNTNTPLNRMMVAQDTGGAIAGAVRADFYWGFGDAAGQQAGRMKQTGMMWVLLPKGYPPSQLPPTVKIVP